MNVLRPPRRGSLLAVALTASITVSGCSGASLGSEEENDGSVKVGLLGVMSGDFATIGTDQVRGFELYLDRHDGRLGGRDVEIVEADEGVDPATAVAAAQRLIRQEQVDAVAGVSLSASALAIKDLFVESEVPLIVSTAGAVDVTAGEPSPYLWRTALSNAQTGESMGEYVAEQTAGGSGVHVIATDFAAGQETAESFIDAFEAAGGKVVATDYPPPGAPDYQPYLDRVKRSGAGAVWAFLAGSDAVKFVQQYDQFGLSGDIPLFGGGTLTDGAVLEAQGDSALGIETALNYSYLLENEVNTEFVTAYEEEYGEPPSGYAMQSYDSAMLLDLAIESIEGDVTPEALAAAIGEVGEIPSPRGPFTLGDDHNPEQVFYLRRVAKVDGELGNVVVEDLGRY